MYETVGLHFITACPPFFFFNSSGSNVNVTLQRLHEEKNKRIFFPHCSFLERTKTLLCFGGLLFQFCITQSATDGLQSASLTESK